ncbi:MAG TPA: GIY-YIG nuclease family protein, partial [Dehalococcoidia bacterium]
MVVSKSSPRVECPGRKTECYGDFMTTDREATALAAHRWQLYLLRCRDGTLYTGISTDVVRRVQEHDTGRGARYTRGRSP